MCSAPASGADRGQLIAAVGNDDEHNDVQLLLVAGRTILINTTARSLPVSSHLASGDYATTWPVVHAHFSDGQLSRLLG